MQASRLDSSRHHLKGSTKTSAICGSFLRRGRSKPRNPKFWRSSPQKRPTNRRCFCRPWWDAVWSCHASLAPGQTDRKIVRLERNPLLDRIGWFFKMANHWNFVKIQCTLKQLERKTTHPSKGLAILCDLFGMDKSHVHWSVRSGLTSISCAAQERRTMAI